MIKSIIIVLCIVFFSCIFTNLYAQSTLPTSDQSLHQTSLQLELRNPAGQLITYVEPTRMFVADIDVTHALLDSVTNKRIITKGGEALELVEFSKSFTFSKSSQAATYVLKHNLTKDFVKEALIFKHEAYFSNAGDVLTAHFSIIRSINDNQTN